MHRTMSPSKLPAPYVREPMSRERAYDVAIAFGLACQDAGATCPIQPKPNGNGFDAVIPMEFLEGLPALKPYLAPRPLVGPTPEPPPYEDPID